MARLFLNSASSMNGTLFSSWQATTHPCGAPDGKPSQGVINADKDIVRIFPTILGPAPIGPVPLSEGHVQHVGHGTGIDLGLDLDPALAGFQPDPVSIAA